MLSPTPSPGQRGALACRLGQPPPWMVTARAMIGLRETPGPTTTPAIANMLAKLHAWWHDDETPWCATFMAYCMEDAGLAIPKAWYRARAWADWGRAVGERITTPGLLWDGKYTGEHIPYGAVCALERGGAGHVTAYVAPVRDRPGMFWGLGGNQGDMVKVAAFECHRILAVRWPSDFPMVDFRGPEVTAIAHGTASQGEA